MWPLLILRGCSSNNSIITNLCYQSLRRVGEREPESHSQTLDGGEAPSQSGSGGHDGVRIPSCPDNKIFNKGGGGDFLY